ncbi:histidine phosphatase family protein [Paeniglutamicibacter sp. ABSL32-1]|uniref:histidine phosphatase family protein n=1 Tax=Paeniglutamicibacter quisquiliarum TaxID=2849498 RepID=UPI001C2D367B|nr:histidine phosphatase family protein [Paeniglutamicibacter quisquiliarum]MBV1778941.1 histidine phosphatase family protein [Paeniglutamicibacter quisquiliarum]
MRLILIRHGQTASNVAQALDTAAPGAPLDETGLAQVRELVKRLGAEDVDAVFSSPLLRAKMTATPLAESRGLIMAEHAGLSEISAGELEMRNDPEAQLAYRDVFFRWLSGDLAAKVAGGEDAHTALERFNVVIEQARAAGTGKLVVVSHAAMLVTWLASRSTNFDPGLLRPTPLANTGVVTLDAAAKSRWTMRSWQDRHLD